MLLCRQAGMQLIPDYMQIPDGRDEVPFHFRFDVVARLNEFLRFEMADKPIENVEQAVKTCHETHCLRVKMPEILGYIFVY